MTELEVLIEIREVLIEVKAYIGVSLILLGMIAGYLFLSDFRTHFKDRDFS